MPSMPIDLPGYYFDLERNRYFPISSRPNNAAAAPVEKPHSQKSAEKPKDAISVPKLLLDREILGSNPVSFSRSMREAHCVQPRVWKYEGTADGAIELGYTNFFGKNTVFASAYSGFIALLKITRGEENERIPTPFMPKKSSSWRYDMGPPCLSLGCCLGLSSRITAIKTLSTEEDPRKLAIIATLGGGGGSGALHMLDLDTVDITMVVRTETSLWTADMFPCGTKASIGTNRKAGVIDLDSGRLRWILHSQSDVLSQKVDSTGNSVVCGLRNGGILSIDIRERPQRSRKPHPPSYPIRMQSSVCSLMLLPSDEMYVLGSAMDGSIRLWDRRLVGREALRSFDGNVNSHTMLQLGLDPTETLLASGGEDGAVRTWSFRTGKLLHTDEGFPSPPSTLIWQDLEGHAWSAWLGSSDGIYCMQGGIS